LTLNEHHQWSRSRCTFKHIRYSGFGRRRYSLGHSTSLLVEGHVLQQLREKSVSSLQAAWCLPSSELTFAAYETVVEVAMIAVGVGTDWEIEKCVLKEVDRQKPGCWEERKKRSRIGAGVGL
jgi:hypothetical protein